MNDYTLCNCAITIIYSKQVMHNVIAHHLLISTQSVPKQQQLPSQLSSVLLPSMMPYDMGHPFGSATSEPQNYCIARVSMPKDVTAVSHLSHPLAGCHCPQSKESSCSCESALRLLQPRLI